MCLALADVYINNQTGPHTTLIDCFERNVAGLVLVVIAFRNFILSVGRSLDPFSIDPTLCNDSRVQYPQSLILEDITFKENFAVYRDGWSLNSFLCTSDES